MKISQYIDGKYLERVKDWHVGDSPWKALKVLQMIEKHQLSFKPRRVYIALLSQKSPGILSIEAFLEISRLNESGQIILDGEGIMLTGAS